MNKKIFLFVTFFLVIIGAFLFFVTHFYSSSFIAQEGYFVTGSVIDRDLMSDSKKINHKNVKLSKMSGEDTTYQKLGRLFVGDDDKKKEININYPLYTNNGLAIVNINSKNKLINSKFETFSSYENFTLTDGKLYNYGEFDQSDYENYIFLQSANGSYTNLVEISFPTTSKLYTIPVNSLVNFQDDYIKYFYYDKKGRLLYEIIEGLHPNDTIKVGKKKYSYEDFLILLGINEAKEEDTMPELIDDIEEPNSDDYILQNSDYNPSSTKGEAKYEKPKVTAENFSPRVYSADSRLKIHDPSGVIIGGINFQLFVGEKLYSRKVFVSSGKIQIVGLAPNTTYRIVGNYKFYSEDKKKMEAQFFEQEITTGDFNSLEPISLSFENGPIYSNKIELNKLHITSSLDNEALNGLNKGYININEDRYSISTAILSSLTKGKEVVYASPNSLKSNTVQNYEIEFYDGFGNLLKISNNKGSTRTSKEAPISSFKILKTEVNYTEFEISSKNTDSVPIGNYRYVIYNNENIIISEGRLDSSLEKQSFTNNQLNPNSTYQIKIFGDYDLLDGNGTVSNAILGEGKFTTMPLSSLGYVRVNTVVTDVTNSSGKITTSIDFSSVSSILLQLLSSFKVIVRDSEDNSIVYVKEYTGEELLAFVSGESLVNEIVGLDSVKDYIVSYTSTVTQGTVTENITVISGIKSFKTCKRDAFIEIRNQFVNSNMIDFDVRVVDTDEAIVGDTIILEVRDPYLKLISMEKLEVNGDFVQLSYTKLSSGVNYSFKYYAEEYNIGYDNTTYENDYVIKETIINTEEGISGSIELQEMLRQITGDNLFNIRDYDRIRKEGNTGYKKYNLDDNAVMFGGKNGYVNFSYYVPELYGKHITVSFYAKYDEKTPFKADAYLSASYSNGLTYKLDGLSEEYKKYTFSYNLTSNYVGFIINTPSSRNERTNVWFKDIKIVSDMDIGSLPVTLSYHISGYRFRNANMYSGREYFSLFDENSTYSKGNPNEGHARITNIATRDVYDFNYTGEPQTFTVPSNGDYHVELWGAAGGKNVLDAGARASNIGGPGSYTSGDITLTKNEVFYIYVGGKGGDAVPKKITPGGWNGGGSADWDHSDDESDGGGGGATDIRVVSGEWDNEESLKSRIMVAAGGGGASDGIDGGAAGALSSFIAGSSVAATQTVGYAFGIGQNGVYKRKNYPVAGGGGGYYGGYATDNGSNYKNPGSGGSSYISGYKGCVAYDKKNSIPDVTLGDDYKEMDEYLASFKIRLLDKKQEIVTNDYYIRIYLDGDEVNGSPYRYNIIDHQVLDEIKQYSLKKNKSYSIVLSVKIRDRFYDLDSINFTTNNEIRSIKTVDEFFDMHPNGKYVVVNDLDFKSINRYITNFYGDVDFQGHTIELNWNGRNYLFYYTRGGSVVKNAVINMYLDNPSAKTWTSPFVIYNYGTIDNIQMNILQSTNVSNQADGIFTYANYGVVKNFVIHNLVQVYAQNRFGLITYSNQGTIKNGYVYGEDINAYRESQSNVSKYVGVIADESTTNSYIRNVFSLVQVKKDPQIAHEKTVGNLLGNAYVGKIEKCFSVETGEDSTNIETKDPNFGNRSATSVKEVYYFSKVNYTTTLSSKLSYLSLYDKNLMDRVLNTERMFDIESFLPLGYYPQLKMNDCMPNLEWIKLPSVTDEDLIDITSTEEVSNDGVSAIVKLHLNNPAAEQIVSVGIQDIQTVEVLSQDDEGGKSVVTVKLSNPLSYKSKYYVRKITSKNSANFTYDTNFNANERPIDLVMYYPIYTIDDWIKINAAPTDNYILMNDLDFNGIAENKIHISKLFEGILNGNGHTIKNITIPSKGGVFQQLTKYAVIKNLFIENYNKTSNTSYGGFVNFIRTGAPMIDNVHMTNVRVRGSGYIGGLVGYGEGGMIVNSSVTSFYANPVENATDIRIGGLVGLMTNNSGQQSADGYISNCFTQDVNIEVLDSFTTYGVGGLVGQMASGSISNSYAVGSIKSNSTYTGGIVGLANAIISNCWSDVNIYSELDYVGGIVGGRDHENMSSTLTLGPIYSNYEGQNINRTSGNTLLIPQKNYFWDQQPFYGFVSGNASAEKPLTSEQLNNRETYYDLLDFGDNFDYTDVENGVLPRLKSTSGELLANQVPHKYASEKFNIVGDIQVIQRVEDGDIYFILDNPDNYQITAVTFDYLKVEPTNITITPGNGVTIVSIKNAKPIRYYDAYTLTGVSYKRTANADPQTVSKFVKINLQFFRNLSSYTDWRSISTTTTENYRLTGDLDFNGIDDFKSNVSIGRLEGLGDGYAIKNLTINNVSSSYGLIKKITTSLKNVRFENITINTKTTGSAFNYCNIIRMNLADMDNVEFKNITIHGPIANYVAPIGLNRGQGLRNMNISYIDLSGKDYVGGLIANSQNRDAFNVSADHVTINATGTYVGGIAARRDYSNPTRWFYFTGTNMNITGGNNTGGLFGYAGADYSTITDSTVTAIKGDYVGGLAGQNLDRYSYHQEVRNVTVTSNGAKYAGGMFGWSYDTYYCSIKDSEVIQNTTGESYAGGFQGNKSGYTNRDIGVTNVKINSQGTGGTGGLYGYFHGAGDSYRNYVTKTEVTGVSRVGGAIGYGNTSRIEYSIINAKVTATNSYAGGIYGYIGAIDAEDLSFSDRAYSILLANSDVIAGNEAALFAGHAAADMIFDKFFYNITLVGNVDVTVGSKYGIALPKSSGDMSLSPLLPRFFVYTNDKLDGTNIKNVEFMADTLSNMMILTSAQLKTKSTYTALGLSSTTYFQFTDYDGNDLLANDYYPFIARNGGYDKYQTPIKIPTSSVQFQLAGATASGPHELPEFDIYSSGINTINIEFNDSDALTKMQVYANKKLIFDEYINDRTYTFNYNYSSSIKIVLSDGIREKVYSYGASDLVNKVSVFKDSYAYIYEGKLKGNVKSLNDNIIHIYGKYALTDNMDIYNLETSEYESKNNDFSMSYANKNVSLFQFEVGNTTIDTYYRYSVIHRRDGDVLYDGQLFYVNGSLEIIDSNLGNIKNTAIVDVVGDKNYVTVLGEDGVIYNLKDEIIFPSKFTNSNISAISNNINNDSSMVVVMYNTGRVVVFDYRTGSQKVVEKATESISVVDYVKSAFSSKGSVIKDNNYNYSNSLEVMKKLEEKPIIADSKGNYVLGDSNNSKELSKYQLNSKYVTYYNSIKEDYDVVDLRSVIFGTDNKVISENDKIYTSNDLVSFYMRDSIYENTKNNVNIVVLLGIILLSVLIALVLWFKNARDLRVEENKI